MKGIRWLDGRAVQGASFRHWSLRRREFKSRSNQLLDFYFITLLYSVSRNRLKIKEAVSRPHLGSNQGPVG